MPIRGVVKWFDPKKGYGFLIGPDEQDVFVHYSQIMGEGFRTLADGDTVAYNLVHGNKGFQAESVFPEPRETDTADPSAPDQAEPQGSDGFAEDREVGSARQPAEASTRDSDRGSA